MCSNKTSNGQQFGLIATLLARYQYLSSGCSLGEWILAVHLLHEILSEWDEQHDAQYTSQQ